MAVSMLTVQHTVEDFSTDPASLSPGIQRSPVKLLNTRTTGLKPCKRRLEDLDLPFGANESEVDEDLVAPLAKSVHLDNNIERAEDLHLDNSVEKENCDTNIDLAKETPDKMYQVPALNGHRDFPCIWLGDTSPSRIAEGGDRSPNSVSQPSPRESQEAPSSISPPNLALASMAPVGSPMKLPTDLSHNLPPQPFNITSINSPVTNGIMSQNHPPPPLLEREPSLEGSPDGENIPVEVCPECHKVFKRKVYLQRHMEREHWSTAKVFKCEDCSYETKHQSNLSVHRRTHTGERPYHCGACGQRYTQGHLLKSHIRSRHGGSMEFYNLDKKSESTRGRKSLDMKHDPAHHGLTKVDKISTLLQVAAANQQLRPPQAQNKFGNLLAPPMTTLPPFFGTMRPMMTPPLGLPGGLLSAPRFFPLGGLVGNNLQFSPPGGLMPTMQQSLQMLANQNNLTASMNFENNRLQEAQEALRQHQKLESPPYFQAHTPSPQPAPVSHQSTSPHQSEEDSPMPQDLSKKPLAPVAPQPAQTAPMELTQPQDLSGGATAATVTATVPANHNHNHNHIRYEKEPGELVSEAEDLVMQTPPHTDPSPDECSYIHRAPNPDLKKAAALLALNLKECRGGNCLYARQLRDLRKNVLRMLSVFTPDLGVENGIDYETDTVDQLLHEVIYSNIEEEAVGKE